MRTSTFSLLVAFLVPLCLLGACGEDSKQPPPPGDSSGVAGTSGAAGSGQAGAAGSSRAGASGVSGEAGSSGISGQSGTAGSAGSGAGEGGQGGASGSGGSETAGNGGAGGAGQGGTGEAGSAGEGGAGGAGAGGEAGAGAAGTSGGSAGSSGASGQSGEAGSGGSESGGTSGGGTSSGGTNNGGTGSGGDGQGGTEAGGQAGAGGGGEPFTLTSAAFVEGGAIPVKPYACSNKSYGTGTSPPLSWTGVPAGTQSFALLVDDPTAGGWVHWVVFNLAASETSLNEGSVPAGVTLGGADGAAPGDGGLGPQYAGPCPPSGVHTYSFRLYALDVASLVGVSSGATKAQVSAAMAGHVLATSELKGKVASSSL